MSKQNTLEQEFQIEKNNLNNMHSRLVTLDEKLAQTFTLYKLIQTFNILLFFIIMICIALNLI